MEKTKTDLDFHDISQKLREFRFPKVDLVIGIATGGTYPAIMVAHQLSLDCRFIHINFRNPSNDPVHPEPVVLSGDLDDIPAGTKILLVDEVSVSGRTINKALGLLKNYDVKTFVLKGKGDYVLFPDVTTCVNWPWKFI